MPKKTASDNGVILVRDTTDRNGATLAIPAPAWHALRRPAPGTGSQIAPARSARPADGSHPQRLPGSTSIRLNVHVP